MNAPALPRSSWFTLHLQLLGIGYCITPSFWIMNAIWAAVLDHFYPGMRGNMWLITYIGLWILVILIATSVHELGHVVTGRIFGEPGTVTLSGWGGPGLAAYPSLRAWQRIVLYAAGPGAGLFLFAFLIALDADTTGWNFLMGALDWESLKLHRHLIDFINPLLRMGSSRHYTIAINLIAIINLFIVVFNLLPIIPMDAGMIFKEICVLIVPGGGGLKFAFVWSFALATACTLFYLLVVLAKHDYIRNPFGGWVYPLASPEISLLGFGMTAYRCYSAYREIGTIQRHSQYAQRDY